MTSKPRSTTVALVIRRSNCVKRLRLFVKSSHCLREPGACHSPVPFDSRSGEIQCSCRFLDIEPAEESALHDSRPARIHLRQILQRSVQVEKLSGLEWSSLEILVQCYSHILSS